MKYHFIRKAGYRTAILLKGVKCNDPLKWVHFNNIVSSHGDARTDTQQNVNSGHL